MEHRNLAVITTAIESLILNIKSMWLSGHLSSLAYLENTDRLNLLTMRLCRGNFDQVNELRSDFGVFIDYLRSFFTGDEFFHTIARSIYIQLNLITDVLIPRYLTANNPLPEDRVLRYFSSSDEDTDVEESFGDRRAQMRRIFNHDRMTSESSHSESSSEDSDDEDRPPSFEPPPTYQEIMAILPTYEQSQTEYASRLGARPRIRLPDMETIRSLGEQRTYGPPDSPGLTGTVIHNLFENIDFDSNQTESDHEEPTERADEDETPHEFISGTDGFLTRVNALGLRELCPLYLRKHGCWCPGCKFNLPHCSDFVFFKDCCDGECCANWGVPAFEVFVTYADKKFVPMNAYEQVYFYKKHLPSR